MTRCKEQQCHTADPMTTENSRETSQSLSAELFKIYSGKPCLIFPSSPSQPLPELFPHLLLHNHSRLYSLQMKKESSPDSVRSGIHFLTMGSFVLVQSGNGREKGRGRVRWRRFSEVAPVTVLPCGPQSEGWSVKEAGQRPKTTDEGKLKKKLWKRRVLTRTHSLNYQRNVIRSFTVNWFNSTNVTWRFV